MSHRSILALAPLAAAVTAATFASPLSAQSRQTGGSRNEFTISAEPVAGGARYLRGGSAGFRLGAGVTVGPLRGITLADADVGILDEWATLHALIGYRPSPRIQLSAGPGAALAIGDDFSSLYPSAQADLEVVLGRFRVATIVRAMRIAGSNGSGDYWIRWIPLRLGIALD